MLETPRGATARTRLAEAKKIISRALKTDPQQAATLAALFADCARRQIDLALRGLDPWRHECAATVPKLFKDLKLKALFHGAIDTLAAHPTGHATDETRCRLRCAFARGYAMAGRFDEAREQLNRAYAFAPKGIQPADLMIRAIYQLHRAEHYILEAVSPVLASAHERRSALLRTGVDSLEQAEHLLRGGRRKVFWWCRLYILEAKASLEQLRSLVLSGLEREVERDRLFMVGLRAIAGGLSNAFRSPQRRAFLSELWDDLQDELLASDPSLQHGSDTMDERRRRWRRLNMQAGLEWFWDEQSRRYPGESASVRIAVPAVEKAGLIDIGRRGMRVRCPALAEAGGAIRVQIRFKRQPVRGARLDLAGRYVRDADADGEHRVIFDRPTIEMRMRVERMFRSLDY